MEIEDRLEVKVLQGRGLPPGAGGTCNPSVKVECATEHQQTKTLSRCDKHMQTDDCVEHLIIIAIFLGRIILIGTAARLYFSASQRLGRTMPSARCSTKTWRLVATQSSEQWRFPSPPLC